MQSRLATLPQRVPVSAVLDETEIVKTEDDGHALIREMLLTSADILPQPKEHRLLVRVHSLANPRSNQALASLCETLNALEVRYPGTKLQLVYQAPRVA